MLRAACTVERRRVDIKQLTDHRGCRCARFAAFVLAGGVAACDTAAAFATDVPWRRPILQYAIDCGVEQKPARWAHYPEVAGASPAAATSSASRSPADRPRTGERSVSASVIHTTDVFLPMTLPGSDLPGVVLQRLTPGPVLDGGQKPRTESAVWRLITPAAMGRPNHLTNPDHALPPMGADHPPIGGLFSVDNPQTGGGATDACRSTPAYETAAIPGPGSSPCTPTQDPAPRGIPAGRGSSDATFARRSARLARSGRSERSRPAPGHGRPWAENIHTMLIRR